MMRFSRSLGLMLSPLLAAFGLTGCAAPAPKPVPAPMVMPATPQQATDLQAEFMKLKPNARVGHVAGIESGSMMAAVSGIPISEVHVGDSVQFLDAKFNTFASGTVTSADATHPEFPMLIVDKIQPAPTGGRLPMNGDLVVYLPN